MNNNLLIIKKILLDFLKIKNINKDINFIIEKPKYFIFAHLSTNISFLLTNFINKQPYEISEEIVNFIKKKFNNIYFKKIFIVKPGFINFVFQNKQLQNVINDVLKFEKKYGSSKKKNYKYNLELVSANPTGLLHIGHARNASIGDSVARILKFAGYSVVTEYYINDAGNQIDILALTIFINYLNLLGKKEKLPDSCYIGEIYNIVAKKFIIYFGDKFINIKFNEFKILDNEVNSLFKKKSIDFFLNNIKKQLKLFRVKIDNYISEKLIYDKKIINLVLDKYKKNNSSYIKDGATWLKTTNFGDEKDRVLIKKDGNFTYITPDLANHLEKYNRTKPNKIVNFWGSDHHNYIIRMQAGLSLLNLPFNLLEIDIIQMVRLVENNIEFKMSKRKGKVIWLSDILKIINVNVIRYMLCSKSPDKHMEFDLNLLKEEKNSFKNPIYNIDYTLKRLNNILKKAKLNNIDFENIYIFDLLNENEELNLLNDIDLFNNIVEISAKIRKPNLICDYIQNIIKQFNYYYNKFKIIDLNNIKLTKQRLIFVKVVYQLLINSLNLIGIKIFKENSFLLNY